MQQTTFASVALEKKGKITRRERSLAERDAVIPWSKLLALSLVTLSLSHLWRDIAQCWAKFARLVDCEYCLGKISLTQYDLGVARVETLELGMCGGCQYAVDDCARITHEVCPGCNIQIETREGRDLPLCGDKIDFLQDVKVYIRPVEKYPNRWVTVRQIFMIVNLNGRAS
jgi:hypothetical protein